MNDSKNIDDRLKTFASGTGMIKHSRPEICDVGQASSYVLDRAKEAAFQ